MKLLFCKDCADIFRLYVDHPKTCHCGKTTGQYEEDGLHAWYSGPAIPLGFANSSFVHAIHNQPDSDWGREFTAFVIQKDCDTFRKQDRDNAI